VCKLWESAYRNEPMRASICACTKDNSGVKMQPTQPPLFTIFPRRSPMRYATVKEKFLGSSTELALIARARIAWLYSHLHGFLCRHVSRTLVVTAPPAPLFLRTFPLCVHAEYFLVNFLSGRFVITVRHHRDKMLTNGNAGWVLLVFLALVCTGSL